MFNFYHLTVVVVIHLAARVYPVKVHKHPGVWWEGGEGRRGAASMLST